MTGLDTSHLSPALWSLCTMTSRQTGTRLGRGCRRGPLGWWGANGCVCKPSDPPKCRNGVLPPGQMPPGGVAKHHGLRSPRGCTDTPCLKAAGGPTGTLCGPSGVLTAWVPPPQPPPPPPYFPRSLLMRAPRRLHTEEE